MHTDTHTHISRWNSSGRVIRPTERPLLCSTRYSQETDIHFFCGFRSRNPSKRAASDPRLRLRDHLDWHISTHGNHIFHPSGTILLCDYRLRYICILLLLLLLLLNYYIDYIYITVDKFLVFFFLAIIYCFFTFLT